MNVPDPIAADLQQIPADLRARVRFLLQRWQLKLQEEALDFKPNPEVLSSLARVWAGSEFVAESCLTRPALLADLQDSGDLTERYRAGHYDAKLALISADQEEEVMAGLRRFRRREMVRIAWRDIAGWADLDETLADLSNLADACIRFALDFVYRKACERRGSPLLADGRRQQMVVLGMGKLGAHELNFSSDVDLIFAYPEEGVLPDKKATTYGEFFTRLAQSLVKVLDEITADGFVFRVDLRLRPYGDSGAIIMSFHGMEMYYLTQAREWERYAMIKARQIAGDFDSGAQLLAMLNAFVYRRYLDYGAFEELRQLKLQITRELKRKDRLDNIKLGPGGIREIEFIAQAFQLIRGGADKTLQVREALTALRLLAGKALLTQDDARRLIEGYRFLRRVENRIQQYQDRQSHDLPIAPEARSALACTLDCPDWEAFRQKLDRVRARVHAVFDMVFSLSKQDQGSTPGEKIWLEAGHDGDLERYGFRNAEAARTALEHFKRSAAVRHMTAKGAAVLDRLMPQLLAALAETANPDETLARILTLFEAVAGRNVYLALLSENPDALARLLKLASASSWICAHLALHPILFDEFLDNRQLFQPLSREGLEADLTAVLEPVADHDVETAMIKLREFKQLNVLRVAAADIMGVIPLMVVSDYLTYIAEMVVRHVIDRAWRLLLIKHGPPAGVGAAGEGFAVLGFGKLGGIELGYGSDLDLVFLYDCRNGDALTRGARPVTHVQFYGRLGQRVRHILDTRLLSGVLYEVDLRLRPNGDSGLLVCHVDAYEDYYHRSAWTWEHQALVRGRFIGGDARLQTRFEAIRRRILCLPREPAKLQCEVREMREKMRAALAVREADKFDLKQGKGGIADIEFIVQFNVLKHAASNAALTLYTDNVRILNSLQTHGFISEEQARLLTAAYCAYRGYSHKRVLQGDRVLIDEAAVADLKRQVERIWRQMMT